MVVNRPAENHRRKQEILYPFINWHPDKNHAIEITVDVNCTDCTKMRLTVFYHTK